VRSTTLVILSSTQNPTALDSSSRWNDRNFEQMHVPVPISQGGLS